MIKKSIQWYFMAFLSFIVSGIFTVVWFSSGATSTLSLWLSRGMALVFELFKINSGIAALTAKYVPIAIRIFLFVLSISTVLYSILASTGFLVNDSNLIVNQTIKQSTSYQQGIEKKDLANKQVSDSDAEINRLTQAKQDALSRLQSQLDAKMPQIAHKDWESKAKYEQDFLANKSNIRQQIAATENKYEELIAAEKANKSKAADNISNLDLSNVVVRYTQGSLAVSSYIGKWLGYPAEIVELTLKIIASILFELMAWISAVMASITRRKELDGGITYSSPISNIVKEKKATLSPNVATYNAFTDEDLKRYLQYMYANAKDGISEGYIKISKNIKLQQDKARKIKAHLEQIGVLKVDGGKTRILKEIQV